MTVAELSGRMSSVELTEWMAFYMLEPWGTEMELMGHAITASTIYNMNRGKRKKALGYKDFMPEFGKVKKEQTVDDMIQFAEMMTVAMGGQDLRVKDE